MVLGLQYFAIILLQVLQVLIKLPPPKVIVELLLNIQKVGLFKFQSTLACSCSEGD